MVWEQASIWIGSEARHDLGFLLSEIPPESECYCGSGKRYGVCHRAENEALVLKMIARRFNCPSVLGRAALSLSAGA